MSKQSDSWQTPKELFAALAAEFDFEIDVCASSKNALLPNYITEEENCLTADWWRFSGRGQANGFYVWANVPYSNVRPFVDCFASWASIGVGCVMLVMADTSVGWYKEAIRTAQEVRFITGGRLSFINPETGLPVNGNNKGSMLIIWHPFCRGNLQVSHVDRDELLAKGRAILEQEQAA